MVDLEHVSPLPSQERNEGSPLRDHIEFGDGDTMNPAWNLSRDASSFAALDETSMDPSSYLQDVIEFDRHSLHNMTTVSMMDMSISCLNMDVSSERSSESAGETHMHNTTIIRSSFELTNTSDPSMESYSKQSVSQYNGNADDMEISTAVTPIKLSSVSSGPSKNNSSDDYMEISTTASPTSNAVNFGDADGLDMSISQLHIEAGNLVSDVPRRTGKIFWRNLRFNEIEVLVE